MQMPSSSKPLGGMKFLLPQPCQAQCVRGAGAGASRGDHCRNVDVASTSEETPPEIHSASFLSVYAIW